MWTLGRNGCSVRFHSNQTNKSDEECVSVALPSPSSSLWSELFLSVLYHYIQFISIHNVPFHFGLGCPCMWFDFISIVLRIARFCAVFYIHNIGLSLTPVHNFCFSSFRLSFYLSLSPPLSLSIASSVLISICVLNCNEIEP